MVNVNNNVTRFVSNNGPRTVGLVGAPFCWGQPKAGVDQGVEYLRQAGLVKQLEKLDWKVKDLGDLKFTIPEDDPPHGILKRPRCVGMANQAIHEACKKAVGKDNFLLALGGDHSLAVGSISGHCAVRDNLSVIWVDAHADINNSETTESGNIHGMPLSWLLGLENSDAPGFEWVKPCLGPSDICYIGLRDLDDGEKMLLRKHNIRAFTMHDVDRHGIGRIVDMALDHVNPHRNRPIHLSFDVDAMDPTIAPSTGTMVRGGLTFREGHYICEAVFETGLLCGLDLVEVNPSIGTEREIKQTVDVGCSLVRCAMGETLL
eukprot:Nk52_evm10s2635 gene=Nk52_evmTU10s2635